MLDEALGHLVRGIVNHPDDVSVMRLFSVVKTVRLIQEEQGRPAPLRLLGGLV